MNFINLNETKTSNKITTKSKTTVTKMNSANLVYLFGVLCVLVSPAFTAPPNALDVQRNAADDAKNEITSDLSNDAEVFQPVNNPADGAPSVGPAIPADAPTTPEFIGGGTGIIRKIGFEGPCKYKKKSKVEKFPNILS